MELFIARQNVEHFQHLLRTEDDPAKRRMIEQLLADARAILEDLDPPMSLTGRLPPGVESHNHTRG